MVKKKNKNGIKITIGVVIGIGAIILYYKLYGWEMLLRTILGSIIFVSITSTFILAMFNKVKNKRIL